MSGYPTVTDIRVSPFGLADLGYAFKGIEWLLEESSIRTLLEIPVRTPGGTDVAPNDLVATKDVIRWWGTPLAGVRYRSTER